MKVKTVQPAEAFASIIKAARLCSALVGADVANPEFRINWITCIVMSSIMGYFIFSVITIAQMFGEKPTYILEASCMLGSVLQGVAKLLSGFKQTKPLVAARFELEELYAEYQAKGSKYCVALNRSCRRLSNIMQLVGTIYALSVAGVVLVPIVLLLCTGQRHLMMHFLIPGLDVETNFGYFGTMAAHSLCMFSGAFGLYAGDTFVLIFLTQSFTFADILKLKIEELNACAENGAERGKWDGILNDIVKWHQKYTRFNEACNNMFYWIITVQITTAGISIVCTLFIMITGGWPGVYAYIWLPLEGLYIYCLLGTQIEICNERFIYEIYNINWFNLSPLQQKTVSIMLLKSQHAATIDVAGVMPLSVNTALQITKSIYSIFMMMIRFLGDE